MNDLKVATEEFMQEDDKSLEEVEDWVKYIAKQFRNMVYI